jgi:nicotinamide riboside kinase
MKVYFIGAHSTGKTTCARYVSEKYGIPMITEAARAVLSEQELQLDSMRYNMKLVNDYQKKVLLRQFQEEKKHSSFVSDRSFDCLAYTAQHSQVLSELLALPELQEYIKELRGQFIFFVRPSKVTLKADGVRETINWEGVVEIDAMVKFMLKMWELPYYQINMDNMQERVCLIDTVLGGRIY